MNSSTYRFVLDLHSTQSQISLPVLIGDTGRTLRISLSDGSNPYIIEDGCLAKLSIKRPTGTRLVDFCTIENNTTIVYPFSQNENTCAVEGIHNCDVVLYGLDGEIIGSPRFTMVVSNRAIDFDDITLTDEDFTEVEAIIKEEASRRAAENKRVQEEIKRAEAEEKRISAGETALKAAEDAESAANRAAEDAREEVTRIIGEIGIVQTTGGSATVVMSQKATNDSLAMIDEVKFALAEKYTFFTPADVAGTTRVWGWNESHYRLSVRKVFYTAKRMYLTATTNYKFSVIFLKDATMSSMDTFIKATGWTTSANIPSDSYFVIVVKRNDDDYLETSEYQNAFVIERKDKQERQRDFVTVLPAIDDGTFRDPFFEIDTTTDLFSIPFDTVMLSELLGDGFVSIGRTTPMSVSMASVTSSAVCVYYNSTDKTLVAKAYNATVNDVDHFLLCTYRRGSHAFGSCPVKIDGVLHSIYNHSSAEANPNVKSINHRGYNTIAPENTLSAYRLSKKYGFNYVECDVAFTSDNVPVLLHDDTVDRTSDGTGNINNLTYEQVRAMDFGSWKSPYFAGEKIPSFEEFIILCRNLGLHPYIEIKSSASYTTAQIRSLVDIVKMYGMRGKVTYISFNKSYLNIVKEYDPNARLGCVCEIVVESDIAIANGLKTDTNEVFIDGAIYGINNAIIALCIDNNIPLEVWGTNDKNAIRNTVSYASGFTTDSVVAGKAIVDGRI